MSADGRRVAAANDIDAAAKGERVMGRLGVARYGGRFRTQGGSFIFHKEGKFHQGVMVAGEMVEVVPTHGVDVSLSDSISELTVMSVEEGIEVFKFEKVLLLNNLGVDIKRSEGFDL